MISKPDSIKIPVGISSCLLGAKVRYDGDHSYDQVINHHLATLFRFYPCCPEVAIGMGIPRDPIRLTRTSQGIRVRDAKDPAIDVTQKLHDFGIETAHQMKGLCGYIFKSRSPSCGLEQVRTFTDDGLEAGPDGVGAFATEITRLNPNLPVTDENRLQNHEQRDNFIEQVLRYHQNQKN